MGSTASIKGLQKLKDFVTWFEIPVYNIQRATTFYNSIYNMEMEMNVGPDHAMAYFPVDKGIGGALVAGPGCIPNATGTLIYLNAGSDMDSVLGRVELAGGRVIMPRTMISEAAGSFALFIDSEGNRLALHEGTGERKGSVKAAKPRTQPKKAVAKSAKPARPAKSKKAAAPAKKK